MYVRLDTPVTSVLTPALRECLALAVDPGVSAVLQALCHAIMSPETAAVMLTTLVPSAMNSVRTSRLSLP